MPTMQETRYIEIARDLENNSQVLLNIKNKSLKIVNRSRIEEQVTRKKILQEFKLAKSKQNTKQLALALYRQIREKLGDPTPGIAIYPKPNQNKKGYYPTIDQNHFSFEEASVSRLRHKPNIVVKIISASICQSDRRVMIGTKPANFSTERLVLGHEGGGYVVDPGVCDDLYTVGQKVVLLPHLTCWRDDCEYCTTYRQNLCTRMQHMGFHIQGNMTSVMAYPEQCVMSVPDELHEDFLPLIEPLACVSRGIFHIKDHLKTIDTTNTDSISKFTIYGGGPIGCLAAICCRIFFKNIQIEIVDPVLERLEILKQLNLADTYVTVPSTTHQIAFIANSYFNSIETAISQSKNDGFILLFSGINTDHFEGKENHEKTSYIKMFEQIHREESRKLLNLSDKNINLLGSSGYNYYDIRRSINLLLRHSNKFAKIQNAIIEGLESNTIKFQTESRQEIDLKQNALLSFLAPEGVFDKTYGQYIAKSVKTLIRIH